MMGGLRAFAQSLAGKAVLVFLAFMLLGSGIVGSIGLFSSRVSSGIQADGRRRILAGETTLEEVLRVTSVK